MARVNFGDWLKRQVETEHREPARPLLQQYGQQMINRFGALNFCLEVLGALPSRLPDVEFMIDGIRHLDVFQALTSLVGPDRFMLISVDRPKEVRRELLMCPFQQPHLS